jgi:RNA polymerase sigma factor (sigma-70 family)
LEGTDAAGSARPGTKRQSYAKTPKKYDSVSSVSRVEWVTCYKTEMPYLTRYLIKCFDNIDIRDAADAAHSAFAELFRVWDTVRYPRAWLRKVAYREMLRLPVKSEYPLDMLDQEPALISASDQLELGDEEQAVLAALRKLPLAQRQVLALLYDQFSYREIAEIMNMTEPAVRKNAERARARMKELLGLG